MNWDATAVEHRYPKVSSQRASRREVHARADLLGRAGVASGHAYAFNPVIAATDGTRQPARTTSVADGLTRVTNCQWLFTAVL